MCGVVNHEPQNSPRTLGSGRSEPRRLHHDPIGERDRDNSANHADADEPPTGVLRIASSLNHQSFDRCEHGIGVLA